jgi:hypothetical protein
MKNMRQLINLMEGVMAVPGIGAPAAGTETDMQTAGTAARNNAYAAFDAAQQPATESADENDYSEYQQRLEKLKADTKALNLAGKHQDANAFYTRGYDQLLKDLPEQHRAYVAATNGDAWKNNDWQKDTGSNRSSIDEKSTSEKQARFMAAAAHNPDFAKKVGISQGVAKEFNQADKGTKQLSKAMKHKNECSMMEDIESPAQVVSCNQSNPANADKACAMENMEQQQHGPEVQQALADFENVVMNLGMAPEDAYERICARLSGEAVQEFGAALQAMGQHDVDTADDSLPQGSDPGGPDWPDRGYGSGSRTGPPEDYNPKDYGSDAMEGIELGTDTIHQIGDNSWFIVDTETGVIGAGPFDSKEEATINSKHDTDLLPQSFIIGYGAESPGDGLFIPADEQPMEEAFNLQNGYDDINDASGNDYFPSGADSPVVKDTGPSGARQGDNPEQKKMQVDEVHKELVYGYRNFLKENAKK